MSFSVSRKRAFNQITQSTGLETFDLNQPYDLVVYDFETGGLLRKRSRYVPDILQIAALRIKMNGDKRTIEKYSRYVQPTKDIAPDASKVNKLYSRTGYDLVMKQDGSCTPLAAKPVHVAVNEFAEWLLRLNEEDDEEKEQDDSHENEDDSQETEDDSQETEDDSQETENDGEDQEEEPESEEQDESEVEENEEDSEEQEEEIEEKPRMPIILIGFNNFNFDDPILSDNFNKHLTSDNAALIREQLIASADLRYMLGKNNQKGRLSEILKENGGSSSLTAKLHEGLADCKAVLFILGKKKLKLVQKHLRPFTDSLMEDYHNGPKRS